MSIEELAAEVADKNFPDARLNERLRLLTLGLSKDPTLSLPQALNSAELEGGYRFCGNCKVTPAGILAGHLWATRNRCQQEQTVLIAHDTTDFSYRYDGDREGLGRVQRGKKTASQTFFAHLSLAICADGTRRPLGVAAFHTWVRGETPTGVEHQRWEAQIRTASSQVDGLENAIHLADREADDYEMFFALQRDRHRFVIRCQHNRLLDEGSSGKKLKGYFSKVESTVEREVSISRRTKSRGKTVHKPRDARTAQLCIAAATVSLKKPKSPRAHGIENVPDTLKINVVHVWEPSPPAGAEAVEWYLYTTEPIETAEQQLTVVDYYRARWTIEEYNKAIKTGCAFESRQLQDYDGLVNLLAIFVPIAYRLLLIRSEAERAPEQPALSVVSQDELDVLRVLGRRKLPEAPTARDAYLAIAALGGHISYGGRRPGWLTLARGYEKLESLTAGWTAAKLQQASDQR